MIYSIRGRVLYGEIHNKDVLHVKRKEREETVTVKKLKNSPADTKEFNSDVVYEGSYAHFQVPEEAMFPGAQVNPCA